MQISHDDALARLIAHDHGVLSTLHPERGVDSVPVVYAAGDGHVGVPIDRVKPKGDGRLQRERNLERDPRAALLIEGWDRGDWTQLWWVRAQLRHVTDPPRRRRSALEDRLATDFAQYRDRPFARMLVLEVVHVSGWAAAPDG